jgi:FixJ family two-component response regulator
MIASIEPTSQLNTAPTVFVVDDDVSVRESLGILIRQAGWRPQLFASAQAFLDHPHVNGPGCLVLDVTLPDLNGLDVQKITSIDRPHMPIIFVTGYGDVPMTVRAMKAGAFDFLTKPFGTEMLDIIERAIDQSQAALSYSEEMRVLRDRYLRLTVREREVLSLVVAGMANKQVADELGISVITVKAHRGCAMHKMKANSLAELVKMEARLSPA